jgi:5-formyltetrahydrofolate cyclo-ligase
MLISEQKKALRGELRKKIEIIPAAVREEASAHACQLLQKQPMWLAAKSVFFYSPLPNEVNIWALVPEALKAGKIVLLPRFDSATDEYCASRIQDIENDLLPGQFGINEPHERCSAFPLNQLDLTLIPALGFDSLGGRLGRGRGFYDRLLAKIPGIKCGIAFDEQIVPRIPVEPHDILLNYVLTPTRCLSTEAAQRDVNEPAD